MNRTLAAAVVSCLFAVAASADVKPVTEQIPNDAAKPEFKFAKVPAPAKDDAATQAVPFVLRKQ